MLNRNIYFKAITLAACLFASAPNAFADTGLSIELNKLEQQQSACRLTLLIENKLETRINDLNFELALFGSDKQITKMLAISAGSFPTRKTRIRQFDLPDTKCESISRFLLNSITKCDGDGLTPENCLDRTRTGSTTKTSLDY